MTVEANREAVDYVDRLRPKIEELREVALQKRDTHALLVIDPRCTIFQGRGARALMLLQREMGRGSRVAVFPLEPLCEMFSILERVLKGRAAGAVAQLREEAPPGRVRMVVMVGSHIGIYHRKFEASSAVS